MNQGIHFPIDEAYAAIKEADVMRYEVARRYDEEGKYGEQTNLIKYLANEASWLAGNTCINTYGGYGLVDQYD